MKKPPFRLSVGLGLLLGMIALSFLWKPLAPLRRTSREARADAALVARSAHVSPEEVYSLLRAGRTPMRLYDLRSESEFNRFHLRDAERTTPVDLERSLRLPARVAKILIADEPEVAEAAWRKLTLRGGQGYYILDGGTVGWRRAFSVDAPPRLDEPLGCEPALGERASLSAPEIGRVLEYTARIKSAGAGKKSGGCGG